LVHRARRI